MPVNKKKDFEPAAYSIGLIILIVFIMTGYGVFMHCYFPDTSRLSGSEMRGQFGDMFGAVNALFSGLALAAIAYTIYLQLDEVRSTNKAIEAQALLEVIKLLQHEDTRNARKRVLVNLKKSQNDESPAGEWSEDQWSKEDIAAAEVVCHTFNSAGMMAKHELINMNILAAEWGTTIRDCWKILSPFVEKRRKDRTDDKFWTHFEAIAKHKLPSN